MKSTRVELKMLCTGSGRLPNVAVRRSRSTLHFPSPPAVRPRLEVTPAMSSGSRRSFVMQTVLADDE